MLQRQKFLVMVLCLVGFSQVAVSVGEYEQEMSDPFAETSKAPKQPFDEWHESIVKPQAQGRYASYRPETVTSKDNSFDMNSDTTNKTVKLSLFDRAKNAVTRAKEALFGKDNDRSVRTKAYLEARDTQKNDARQKAIEKNSADTLRKNEFDMIPEYSSGTEWMQNLTPEYSDAKTSASRKVELENIAKKEYNAEQESKKAIDKAQLEAMAKRATKK